ncbi:hypothetical protein ACTI_47910 [Actinoplanes sp. OR16]|uniref:hypothetical protein n=1 Tax=Actinoplanes sp. OR16 TaxID=946334 RepID=UPI000F6CA913|nr:hypothetical protein [Actinoplanes sp. OR16]BBH68106.1 hypothetical protein ACTI_47910 [Actinoplanes sp. OR16]
MANRFQLWGQAGWASAEVVGETHYAKAIRALFGSDFNPQGTDITVPLQLIPDPKNRHDRNAVGVWSGQSLLGHLPRPEAARYVKVLSALHGRGLVPEVNGQIHGREWGEYDGRPPAFVGTIRLDLAEPHMLFPANDPPPAEHRLLPSGSAVQVNGQQQFLDALRPLLRPEGECWAYVTLHEMADHLVEVRIGDARVGDLSPKMSGELLPTLRHLSEQGLLTAARGIVKGNAGEASVMLYISRVQDLPEAWQGRQATSSPAFPASPSSGRAAAAPGAASTGPATPGAAPGPAGGISPNWSTPDPNRPAEPSWAAAAADASQPSSSWTPPGDSGSGWTPPGDSGSGWTPPGEPGSGRVTPSDLAPGWTPPGEPGSGRVTPSDLAPGWTPGDATPSWAAQGEQVPSWAARDDVTQGWAPGGSGETTAGWQAGGSGLRLGIASDAGLGRTTGDNTAKRDAALGGAPDAPSGREAGFGLDAAGLPVRPAGGEPAVPSWATPGEAGPSWATSGETGPSWASSGDGGPSWNAPANEAMPTWAAPGEAVPSWAVPGAGIPAWATPSATALPTLPSTGSLPGSATPRLDPPADPDAARPSSPAQPSALPGSPAALAGSHPATTGSQPALPGAHASNTGSHASLAGSHASHTGSQASLAGAHASTTGSQASLAGSPVSFPGSPVAASAQAGSSAPTSAQAGSPVSGVPAGGSAAPASSFPGSPAPGAPADGLSALPGSPVAASPGGGSSLATSPSSGGPSPADAVSGGSSPAEGGSADPFGRPVSPAPGGAHIAETTVIPALAAVVKSNPSRLSVAAPVSPAPEATPHPPIPGAPTGIKFVVPPGWPVPPDGWYPPEGWRPDAGWPLAPAGWQWWVPVWE